MTVENGATASNNQEKFVWGKKELEYLGKRSKITHSKPYFL
jgi:hypothetical protein